MVRSRKEHPNLESWLRVGQISEAGPHLGSWFLAGSRSAVVGADCRPVSRSQTTAPSPSIIQAFGRSRAGCRLQSEICPAFRDLLWGLRSAPQRRFYPANCIRSGGLSSAASGGCRRRQSDQVSRARRARCSLLKEPFSLPPTVACARPPAERSMLLRRLDVQTVAATTPSSARSRFQGKDAKETYLRRRRTMGVVAGHGQRESVPAEAPQKLRELPARELACAELACRWSCARMLCCIRVCGSNRRPRMRERLRGDRAGDVIRVVGCCGALAERIAAACDVPVRRVAQCSVALSFAHVKQGYGGSRDPPDSFFSASALGRGLENGR